VKTWASASTLGVERAPPRNFSSNERERAARQNPRNVADTGEVNDGRCCQQNTRYELGQKGAGSPKTMVSNYLSDLLTMTYGSPARKTPKPPVSQRCRTARPSRFSLVGLCYMNGVGNPPAQFGLGSDLRHAIRASRNNRPRIFRRGHGGSRPAATGRV
jgi:hypothetical protein